MAYNPVLLPGADENTVRLNQAFDNLASLPILRGEMVQDVDLVAGELTLRHRLGRRAIGCILVLTDREVTFRVTSNRPDRLVLYVTSQANPVPSGGKANFYVW